jgi:hypothetical protein
MKILLAPCAVELHQPIEKYQMFTRDYINCFAIRHLMVISCSIIVDKKHLDSYQGKNIAMTVFFLKIAMSVISSKIINYTN